MLSSIDSIINVELNIPFQLEPRHPRNFQFKLFQHSTLTNSTQFLLDKASDEYWTFLSRGGVHAEYRVGRLEKTYYILDL